jgi:hypothetical protein
MPLYAAGGGSPAHRRRPRRGLRHRGMRASEGFVPDSLRASKARELRSGETPRELRWTTRVRPSFRAEDVLPADVEREALRRGIDWYFHLRMVMHPSMRAIHDLPTNAPTAGSFEPDPTRACWSFTLVGASDTSCSGRQAPRGPRGTDTVSTLPKLRSSPPRPTT